MGATPPSCEWPNASLSPVSLRNLPSLSWIPSDAPTAQKPCCFTIASTRARNVSSSKAISGKSRMCGASAGLDCASPVAAVIHPAWRPITSRMKTLVGLRHRLHVQARLAHAGGDVLRHRAEAGARIGDRQVVVDGLGHVHRDHRIAHLLAQLRHLEARVGGIVAAVVEEVADVVRPEDLDEALVLEAALLHALELVARGAEGAARRM